MRQPKRGDGAVSVIDATGRRLKIPVPELIDLTARVLVVVFQTEGGKVDDRTSLQFQIKPEYLARKAIVYLRQSSDQQVRQNKESQRLQYDLADRMRALGWKELEVRQGFKRNRLVSST